MQNDFNLQCFPICTSQFKKCVCEQSEVKLQVTEDEAEYEDRVVMTDEEGRTRQAHPDFILFFFFFIFLFFYLIFLYFILQGNPPTFTFFIFFLLQGAHCGRSGDRQRECPYLTLLFENISVSTNKSICLLV